MAENAPPNPSTPAGPKLEELQVIHWPDPRLLAKSQPVTAFDDALRRLAQRMFELMRQHEGVGLAAPQVGVNLRLFVANPTGKPEDDQVYVNPVLSDWEGAEEAEEGCLSLPEIRVMVNRSTAKAKITAQDLNGQPFERVGEGFITRVWQHENDHLNGVLILKWMGEVAKMHHRKQLKVLEDEYAAQQAPKKKRPPFRPPF